MKSETWTIQQVFQDRKQYKVPFYQRAYVWTLEKQWPLLWADIMDKAEERLANTQPAPHFLGAIVCAGLPYIKQRQAVDGNPDFCQIEPQRMGIRPRRLDRAGRRDVIKPVKRFASGIRRPDRRLHPGHAATFLIDQYRGVPADGGAEIVG